MTRQPLVPTDLLFSDEQLDMLNALGRAVARGEIKPPRLELVLVGDGKRRSRSAAPPRRPACADE